MKQIRHQISDNLTIRHLKNTWAKNRRKSHSFGRYTAILLLFTVWLLTACGNSVNSPETGKQDTTGSQNEKTYKIGILQIAEHSALDENRNGFLERLRELGIPVEVDYQNAQGNVSNALSMAQKFVDDKVDLIFAIATPSAQAAKQAVKDSGIPIVFSAVTDPVEAQLVESLESPNAEITGTSDKTPTKQQLEIFRQIKPEVQTIGIIYNTGETNSEVQLKEAEKAAEELGLTILPVGVTSVNDIPKAMEVIVEKADAMYNLTDNLVASSMELISHLAIEHKLLIVQSYMDESAAAEGVLISNGFRYYDLGSQTGDMAKDILTGTKKASEIPVGKIEKTQNLVRKKAMEALQIEKELPIIKEATILE